MCLNSQIVSFFLGRVVDPALIKAKIIASEMGFRSVRIQLEVLKELIICATEVKSLKSAHLNKAISVIYVSIVALRRIFRSQRRVTNAI